MRESPALDVIRLLEEHGADVTYHDPHVAKYREDGHERASVALTDDVIAKSDAVVIVTDHSSIDYQRLVDKASLVVDTRNALSKTKKSRARIVSLTPTAPHA
jgi:UDP-N-acetyl-D-glucosamine dehydrogenase